MKTLLCCILITGVVAGLILGLRQPQDPVAKSAQAVVLPDNVIAAAPPARTPTLMAGWMQPTARARRSTEDEIVRALRSGTAEDRDRVFNSLLPDLVSRNPSMAGHLALAWEPGALHDELLSQVIRRWVAIDLGGAITWMTSLLNEADRQTATQAATAQVAQNDRAGAMELAQLLQARLDDDRLEHLAELWTEENPREAVDWVVQRPADALRDRLLARIAYTRAQRAPAEAAGLVLDHMTPGDARDEALLDVVREWAGRDPAPVTAWVAQFPAGPLRTRALAEVAAASQVH